MSRYRTTRLRTGAVVQAGLDPKAQSKSAAPMQPGAGIYRGVVLKSYVTDDADNFRKFQVECDIILVKRQFPLWRVPVRQANHGVNNAHDLWVPKETTRSISEGIAINLSAASRRGTPQGPVTRLDDFDGDMVLVEFIEGRLDMPIITGAFTHERTKRKIIRGNGWVEGDPSSRSIPHSEELFTAHAGTEIRINRKGDVLIDTVGATDDIVNEVPTVDSGQVRVRVKGSQKFTIEMDGTDVLEVWQDDGGVHVDIGEGATEHIILGDKFKDLVYNLHTHPSGTGPTGQPTPQMSSAELSAQHRVK